MIVTIESFWPEMTLPAEVVAGSLRYEPQWTFHTVNIGPWRASEGYGTHLAGTIGSSYDSGDELRFDRQDRLLRSVLVTMPDQNAEEASEREWLDVERHSGLLMLCSEAGFCLNPVDTRWFDESGKALVCLAEHAKSGRGARLRVSIARDFDLVFLDGRYCGWILLDPVSHLVPSQIGADDTTAPASSRVVALIREYLTIVADPNIEKMNDHDEGLLNALLVLRRRTQEAGDLTASDKALAMQIDDILDRFYGIRSEVS
jgi:hypothetical protein